jgi:hypothetical protein
MPEQEVDCKQVPVVTGCGEREVPARLGLVDVGAVKKVIHD